MEKKPKNVIKVDTKQIRWLSFLLIFNIVICTADRVGVAVQSVASDIELEEHILVTKLDKGTNKGSQSFQTATGLQLFMIQFWIYQKYECIIAEADKILQKYPDELQSRVLAFVYKHRALLLLGRNSEAQRLYDEVRGDNRRLSFGFETSLGLYVKYFMTENVMRLRRAALDFDGAIKALKDMRRVAGEIQNDCEPGWAKIAEYYVGANIDIEMGDIYRLWGKYNTAAAYYQKALDYMVTHRPPFFRMASGSAKKYIKRRDRELAALIADCKIPSDGVTDVLALKRNVDYRYELMWHCINIHNFDKADILRGNVLEYFKSKPLLLNLPESERDKYEKIRDKILEEGSVKFCANVDNRLKESNFCTCCPASKEKEVYYCQKALGFLKTHPVPAWLSQEKKAHYHELKSKIIPERISQLVDRSR